MTASLAAGDFTAGASTLLTNYVLPTTASGAGPYQRSDAECIDHRQSEQAVNGNTNAALTGANFSLSGLVTRRGDQRHADSGNVQQQGCGHGRHGDGESGERRFHGWREVRC